MYRLIHIESGFEFSFATLEEAIEYLETYDRQEEFEIRRQTARSIFFKKVLTKYEFYGIIQIQ